MNVRDLNVFSDSKVCLTLGTKLAEEVSAIQVISAYQNQSWKRGSSKQDFKKGMPVAQKQNKRLLELKNPYKFPTNTNLLYEIQEKIFYIDLKNEMPTLLDQ